MAAEDAMSDTEVTPAMTAAGVARLAAWDDLEAWGDGAALFVAEVYRAMAAEAPTSPSTGKSEPPPQFDPAPPNVTQIAPRKD